MGYSHPPRCWRSSWPDRSTCRSSSYSGSRIEVLDLADEVALGGAQVREMHAPTGNEEAEYPYFPADPVCALVGGIGVGPDREIAPRSLVDAAARDQALGAQKWA